jgi:hypothetical protein
LCAQFPLPRGKVRRQKFMDIWRNSRELEEVRSIHIKDFAGLLNLRAHHCLHPLSGLGVHGGQHARTRQRRRESLRQHVAQGKLHANVSRWYKYNPLVFNWR